MNELVLRAKLQALDAAREAVIATITVDGDRDVNDAKMEVANDLFVQMELVQEQLDGVSVS